LHVELGEVGTRSFVVRSSTTVGLSMVSERAKSSTDGRPLADTPPGNATSIGAAGEKPSARFHIVGFDRLIGEVLRKGVGQDRDPSRRSPSRCVDLERRRRPWDRAVAAGAERVAVRFDREVTVATHAATTRRINGSAMARRYINAERAAHGSRLRTRD